MATQEEIQKYKSTLSWFKVTNWLCDFPSLKNNVFLKVYFRAVTEFYKLSEVIKKGNFMYKKIDEIDEQLDENRREIKNILGEILEETNLFYKKFNEDEEGENEKKLKNKIIEILKLSKAFFEILDENFFELLDETLEEQK